MAGRQVARRRGFGRIEWRQSGRYRAAYTGPDGRLYRAPSTFAARDDAAAWLSARRAEIDLRLWAPEAAERAARRNSLPTFREYAEKWLAGRRTRGRELRPSTASGYRSLLAKHIYPRFGDVVVDQITSADVNTWYDQLTPGRYTTRSKAYSLLRTIMNGAATERPYPLVPYNPAHIRGAGNPDQIHRVRPASLSELQTIVEELPDRYKLMALLGAWCALRLGELCELRRADIDVERERVMVTRGVVRVEGEFIVGPPKTEAGRP